MYYSARSKRYSSVGVCGLSEHGEDAVNALAITQDNINAATLQSVLLKFI